MYNLYLVTYKPTRIQTIGKGYFLSEAVSFVLAMGDYNRELVKKIMAHMGEYMFENEEFYFLFSTSSYAELLKYL